MKVYLIMQEMEVGEDKITSINSTHELAEEWLHRFCKIQSLNKYYIQEWDVE